MARITKVSLKKSSIINRHLGLQQADQIGKKCRFILGDKLDNDLSDIHVYFIGNKEVKNLKDTFHFKGKDEFSTTIQLKTFRKILMKRDVEQMHSRLDIIVASLNTVVPIILKTHLGDGLIVIREEKNNVEHNVTCVSDIVKDKTLFDVCTSEDFLGTFVGVLERIFLYQNKDAIVRLRSLYECRRQCSIPPERVLAEVYNDGTVDDQTTEQNQSKMMGSKRKRAVNYKCGISEPSTSGTRSGKRFKYSYEDDTMQVELDLIKDTLHEAIALYRRSLIPDNENPFPKKELPSLTCELAKAIYAVDERIYGCGFRNYTLGVFVNLIKCMKSDEDRLSLQNRIKKVAENFHIDEIDVNFGRFDKTQMSSCQVGSKVKIYHDNGTERSSANANGHGHRTIALTEVHERRQTRQRTNAIADTNARIATLGGFATNAEQQLFLLLSRHFADPDLTQSVFFIDIRNREHILANVLKGQTRGIYDISIATVLPSNIRNTRFRALNGEQMDSILEDFGPQSDVGEKPVFFWSWESGPRKGKIAIQDFNERSSDAKLILLEDIMEYNAEQNGIFPIRMAENGHSGAIICAEDLNHHRVRVFTMLMGALNYKEIKKRATGWKKQGLYRSLPLCEGIQQLNVEHRQNFNIC